MNPGTWTAACPLQLCLLLCLSTARSVGMGRRQALLLAVLSALGALTPLPGSTKSQTSAALANWLICIECLPFALAGWKGFRPSAVYPHFLRVLPRPWPVSRALCHALALSDILEDTAVSFKRQYREFVRQDQRVLRRSQLDVSVCVWGQQPCALQDGPRSAGQ